jgi:hypothetical protein
VLPTEGPRPPFCRQRVRWTHKQCLAVKTRFTPISICMQRIRCANGCVCLCLCLCVCVCVCDSGRRTSATWSWRLASRRGPQPDRMCSLLASRVATWTAAVIWGSLAQSVCGAHCGPRVRCIHSSLYRSAHIPGRVAHTAGRGQGWGGEAVTCERFYAVRVRDMRAFLAGTNCVESCARIRVRDIPKP